MYKLNTLKLFLAVAACMLFSCNHKPYEKSPFVGNWELQQQIVYEDKTSEPTVIIIDDQLNLKDTIYPKIDITESYWAAHDALCYSFKEDGTVFITGGPEPIDQDASFKVEGDSLIISCPMSERFNTIYNILDIGRDTIWVCEYAEDGILYSSNYSFFIRTQME